MEYLIIGVLMLIGYVLVYSLIDRICKCIEYCANAKALGTNGAKLAEEIFKNKKEVK